MMDTQRLINFSSKLTSPTSKLVHTLTQSFRAWAQTYCTDQVLQTEVDNLVQSNSKIYDRRMRNNRDYLNQQSAILLKQFVANTLLPKYFNTVSNDQVMLIIPSKEEYLGLVRLLVSGFAFRMNFNYDEIEEIKIAVAEVCMNAIKHAYKNSPSEDKTIQIILTSQPDGMEIKVEDHGIGFKYHPEEEPHGFGLAYLKQYMELVELHSDPGTGTSVQFRKHHEIH